MSTHDLRKPQIALKKAEKHLAAAAAAITAAGGIAHADEALNGAASAAQNELKTAFLALADKTANWHAELEAKAVEVGGRLLAEGPGPEKDNVRETVQSILGLG